jgi:cysteine synthase B
MNERSDGPRVLEDIASGIGATPLQRLRRLETGLGGGELWAKLEWQNASGSVKDRAALAIVRDALAAGRIGRNRRLLDATSGNTGISYAMLGAALGFGVTLVLPANASVERRKVLYAYGAELVLTDALEGMDLAIETARDLARRDPARYFHVDQYSNPANWRAHYDGTAVEILEQTRGRMTHFVAGLGTTGTFVGTARRLRETRPGVRRVAVMPDSPYHGLEGLKHLPSARVPASWDPELADDIVEVSTEVAQEMVLRLAREEGLLVGMSSGAAVVATRRLMRKYGPGVYVTVLPDNGLKYLGEPLFALDHELESRVAPEDGGLGSGRTPPGAGVQGEGTHRTRALDPERSVQEPQRGPGPQGARQGAARARVSPGSRGSTEGRG